MDAIRLLLRSRKFWMFVLTGVSDLVIYFVTKYAAPEVLPDVQIVLGFITGLAGIVIAAIAYEDGQEKRGGLIITPQPEPDLAEVE